jgi:hypothetical protein
VREDHGWFQIFVSGVRPSNVPGITVTQILNSYKNFPKFNNHSQSGVTVVSDRRRLDRQVQKGIHLLGIIADDFTGATDVATMLRRSGHRVAVVIEDGVPASEQLAGLDAVVVALKSRSLAADEAVPSAASSLGARTAFT